MENFEIDRTEEEREELVKQWINNYWLVIVFTIGAAIAAVYGLNYYKRSKINKLSQLSTETQLVSANLEAKNFSEAKKALVHLQEQEEGSFAVLATFDMAKALFDEKKYIEAAKNYEWIIQHAEDVTVKDIARLRKARAQANNGNIGEATVTLENIESSGFISESLLLKGDLLLSAGQFDAAKHTYESLQAGNEGLVKQRIELINIKKQMLGEK